MSEPLKHSHPQVGMISLGCAKNLVDAEIMLGALLRDGVRIINDPAKADVVIVNTCSFIDSAQEESVDAILESAEVREANRRGQALVVAGCLSQRFRKELPALLPEVDAFMGIDQVARVTEIIQEAIARRATKLNQQPGSGSRTGAVRKAIAKGLADLDRRSGGNREGDTGESLRGTERFGKTRTIISVPPPCPAAAIPYCRSMNDLHTFPITRRPGFA